MDEGALTFDEAEAFLTTAEFNGCRPLWHSSNYVFLAQLTGGDEQTVTAVYKPRRGESPLWDFPQGTLYRREAAAYRLARLLGWEFVPPTVIREGPEGVGSVQLFISHDPNSHYFVQRDEQALVPQLQRIAVFDFIANNADRKGGHCLLDEDGRIWGIDHGLCFHEEYKMRTVIWDWAEEPVPAEWLADVEALGQKITAAEDDALAFLDLISAAERTAMLGRIARLLDRRVFPSPGPHRSYPWPLV